MFWGNKFISNDCDDLVNKKIFRWHLLVLLQSETSKVKCRIFLRPLFTKTVTYFRGKDFDFEKYTSLTFWSADKELKCPKSVEFIG